MQAGDEVIVFEPMFDSYLMNSVHVGAKFVPVSLKIEVSEGH